MREANTLVWLMTQRSYSSARDYLAALDTETLAAVAAELHAPDDTGERTEAHETAEALALMSEVDRRSLLSKLTLEELAAVLASS